MSAVLSLPRDRRRASVPLRVLLPWVLAIAGCFSMALGVGYGPSGGTDSIAPVAVEAGIATVSRVSEASQAAPMPAEGRLTGKTGAPAGSPALRSLALLAFVAALAAAVLGSYRGYALNGD